MVPTDEAIITRQMLYSAFLIPATCAAFAIFSSLSSGVVALMLYLQLHRTKSPDARYPLEQWQGNANCRFCPACSKASATAAELRETAAGRAATTARVRPVSVPAFP